MSEEETRYGLELAVEYGIIKMIDDKQFQLTEDYLSFVEDAMQVGTPASIAVTTFIDDSIKQIGEKKWYKLKESRRGLILAEITEQAILDAYLNKCGAALPEDKLTSLVNIHRTIMAVVREGEKTQ